MNVVMVPKKINKFRMYIDFKNLNKVGTKDPFSCPNIDLMIDVKVGYEIMSFLDMYSGNN